MAGKRRSKKKKVLFAVEILVLLVFIGGLYVYGQLNTKLDKIQQPVLDESKIKVNQEVQDSINSETSTLTGYTTYALFGIDHRDKNTALGGENSDTIIIASVNNDTKDVKLVSVYRDTLLNIGNDMYSKANAAYAAGDAEQAINMLNTNLDFALTDYVTVNFKALADAIDVLGGLDIEMTNAECVHANNYNREVSEAQGVEYEAIPYDEDLGDDYSEVRHVSGALATSYARIRYGGGDDAKRTSRQRIVINLMVQKLKQNPTKIPEILDKVMGNVSTSLTKNEILELGMHAVTYTMGTSYAYPFQLCYGENVVNALGEDVVIPVTLEFNVRELHEYLYPGLSYEPSAAVTEYSDYIARKSGYDEDMIGYVLNQGPGAEAESVIAGD